MSTIHGITVHGCWSKTPFFKEGNVLTEDWSDEYGLSLREIKEYSKGAKFLRELISLSRGEPDVSMFQSPPGYESVTLEMDEVPCEQQPPIVIKFGK